MGKRVLTGIKPTGDIHVGNYIGAIKAALELAKKREYQTSYFIADYHGLTKIHDADRLRNLRPMATGHTRRRTFFFEKNGRYSTDM